MANEDRNKKEKIEALKLRLSHVIEDCERRSREAEQKAKEVKKFLDETVKIYKEYKMYIRQQPEADQGNCIEVEVTSMIHYVVHWLDKKNIIFKKCFEEAKKRKRRRPPGDSSSQNSTMLKNFSVLVVDDDSHLRNFYGRLLNWFGSFNIFQVKVEKAANIGKEAADILRCGVSFDLIIITDMDRSTYALEEIKELRALAGESNIIIGYTSGTTEGPDQEQALMEAGLNGFFQKPVTLEIISPFLLNPPKKEKN